MEDKVLAVMQQKGGVGVSFVELQDGIGKDSRGDIGLYVGNDPNLVLWPWCSEAFADAMMNLVRSRAIALEPTSPLVYLVDGRLPTLPIAKRPPKGGYAKPHWLPVVFNLSPAHRK